MVPRGIKKIALVLALGFQVALSGCGFYNYKAVLPDNIRKIYIPVFVNHSPQYNIEGLLTDMVIREFASEGKLVEGGYLTVVPTKEQADAELDGEIVQYMLEPAVVDDRGSVQEYRMRILLNLNFKDVHENKSIWAEQNKESKEKIFWKAHPAQGLPQTEQEAQLLAFKSLAKDMVSRTIWGW